MDDAINTSAQQPKRRYRIAKSESPAGENISALEALLNTLLTEKKIREIDRAFGLFLQQQIHAMSDEKLNHPSSALTEGRHRSQLFKHTCDQTFHSFSSFLYADFGLYFFYYYIG